jgi:hypothetical protein
MGGGLLQLVAYGAQDVYLTGNPQITFFKVVYRRHTNFAIEAIQQTPTGSNTLGSRASFQITRNGDLIHRIYFHANINNKNASGNDKNVALVPHVGHKLLKTVELEIGGQRIDKHYSEWLYIWNELSLPFGKRDGYYTMVGANDSNQCTKLAAGTSYELYVPLEFWFCRNVGLALPLIALQYHEVKINIEYESAGNLVDIGDTNFSAGENTISNGNRVASSGLAAAGAEIVYSASADVELVDANLWVDYIFLDTDERRRFAQLSHEYLIEQLQFTGTDSIDASSGPDNMKSLRMNFNHPCKELIWTIKRDAENNGLPFWNNFGDCDVGVPADDVTNPFKATVGGAVTANTLSANIALPLAKAIISLWYNLINITKIHPMKNIKVLMFILLHLNQKNINQAAPLICRA